MIPWWQLHPLIAPLPRSFMDSDTSHKQAKEWMHAATEEIERLTEELRVYREKTPK